MARLTLRASPYTLPLLAFVCSLSVVLYFSFNFSIQRSRALNLELDVESSATTQLVDLSSSEANNEDPPADEPAPRILLVSAFFPLPKSKHSAEDYLDWLKRFLGTVSTDLYFFCPPELADMIRSFRGDLPIVIDMSYTSPFHVPPLKPHTARYKEMHNWDREKSRHSPDLYAVWNAKPYLLEYGSRIARANGNIYDYVFWIDAGAMRDDDKYEKWPDGRRVREVFEMGQNVSGTPKKNLIFFPIWDLPDPKYKYWAEDMGPVDSEFSEGSFFGGTPTSIIWFRRVFYTYHDYYLSKDKFVGKDQTLFNALFFLFPSRFFGTSLWDTSSLAHAGIPFNADTPHGTCGNTWYYFEWWLASKESRSAMAEKWLTEAQGRSRTWKNFWRTSVKCREADASGMEGMLKRLFGKGWISPMRSVKLQYI